MSRASMYQLIKQIVVASSECDLNQRLRACVASASALLSRHTSLVFVRCAAIDDGIAGAALSGELLPGM